MGKMVPQGKIPLVSQKMKEFAHRYQSRQGGYTRLVRAGQRKGDASKLAYIEYIDRPGEFKPARGAVIKTDELRSMMQKRLSLTDLPGLSENARAALTVPR